MPLLIFFIVLSILVLVHELGHFLAAKKAGILVEEFGFGYPPRVWAKRLGETIYSLNLLPFGGFVKLYGEEGPSFSDQLADPEGEKRAFFSQPILDRFLVVVAGVVMNFLLAVAVFSVIYSITGIPGKQGWVEVVAVAPGSPAEEAGIREKDIVKNFQFPISNFQIRRNEDFIKLVNNHLGEEIALEIERQEESFTVTLVPRKEVPEGEGPLGVVIMDTKMVFYPWWQRPFRGTWWGVKEAVGWGLMVAAGIGAMLYQLIFKGMAPEGVAGPVGIYEITRVAARSGGWTVAQFLGILSVNLAVINILPLPALDGGRLLFLGIEKLSGRRVKAKYERWIHTIGLAILVSLMILITFRDIQRMVSGGT